MEKRLFPKPKLPRKKCPACNSSKIEGTAERFFCERCGYKWVKK